MNNFHEKACAVTLNRVFGYKPSVSRELVACLGCASAVFELDRDGDIVTPLSSSSGECAFCHFLQDGSCLCSIEKAGRRKPVSCSLYPIRVTNLTGGGKALNVHHWDICKPAFEKGRREGVRVYQFLRNVLTDCYGEDFWSALDAAATHLLSED